MLFSGIVISISEIVNKNSGMLYLLPSTSCHHPNLWAYTKQPDYHLYDLLLSKNGGG